MSIHVRQAIDGKYLPDIQKLKTMVEELKRERALSKYQIEFSETFSNILIMPKDVNKATGLNALRKIKDFSEIIFVGDDLFDKELCKTVDIFCAVNNADKEIKEIATFVSKENYAKGVYEILQEFLK